MHLAAGNGHTELVRWLLREEPTLADAADTSSATPLHFACAGERSQTTRPIDPVRRRTVWRKVGLCGVGRKCTVCD